MVSPENSREIVEVEEKPKSKTGIWIFAIILVVILLIVILVIFFVPSRKLEGYKSKITILTALAFFLTFVISLVGFFSLEKQREVERKSYLVALNDPRINRVDQLVMQYPELQDYYEELYRGNSLDSNKEEPSIPNGVRRLRKQPAELEVRELRSDTPMEDHLSSIILRDIEDAILLENFDEKTEENAGWYNLFSQWMKSSKLQNYYLSHRQFYSAKTREFLNRIIKEQR